MAVVQSMHHTVVLLASVEPTTSSTTQLAIVLAENNLPFCNKFQYHVPRTVYLGETFQVSVVVAGQRGGTVPSTVRSVIMRNEQGIIFMSINTS